MNTLSAMQEAFASTESEGFPADCEMISLFNTYMPEGMRILDAVCVSVSREAGELTFSFNLDERFTNAVGFVAGGYIAQTLDQAATYASTFVTGKASPSIDLNVSFVMSAKPGRFTAIGSVVKVGENIAFLKAKLLNSSNVLVATGTVTALLLPLASLVKKAGGYKPD